MAVNSTHPDYDVNAPAWSRARDVLAGEDAVKAAGEKYLPRLDSQSDEEYAAYKARASFFGATARTLEEQSAPQHLCVFNAFCVRFDYHPGFVPARFGA